MLCKWTVQEGQQRYCVFFCEYNYIILSNSDVILYGTADADDDMTCFKYAKENEMLAFKVLNNKHCSSVPSINFK